MTSVADFNPLAPETLECPFPFYQALHEEAPVYEVPGLPFVIVSSYELLSEVVHDPHTYSSKTVTAFGVEPPPTDDPELQKFREAAKLAAKETPDTLLSADPPHHARYRALVNKALSARRVAGMEDYCREVVTEIIDSFIDDGKVELVKQFADELPMSVIADQIGIPRTDLKEYKQRADLAIGGIETKIPPEMEKKAFLAGKEMQQFFISVAEERRQNPKDDIMTTLATAEMETDDEPRRLTDNEILSILQQLQVAGKETTAHCLGMTMLALLENPEQMEALQNDPSLIPNMVEESLRFETPVRALFRIATKDTELGGEAIAKGQNLMLIYAAANRDNEQFPEAEKFDVGRENSRTQMAFSAGPHYCVGSALARLEIRVAYEELLSRMKNIRRDPDYPEEPTHTPSFILRGLSDLHLLFDKA